MMGAQWEQIRAGEILTAIEGEWFAGSPETIISRVSTDSRNIGEGSLFWALEGERFDGHDYAEQAVEKGAAGVVVRQGYEGLSGIEKQPVVIVVQDTLKALGDLASWWRHQHHVAVAAITGSAGKTTTKEMTAEILAIGSWMRATGGRYWRWE
ncbi:MAG: hypothetical protein JRG79_01925 [Deltaproteobacteria bacterium]|nr:hypothetical protein [Deltaproteobacteria bacterium]